MLGTDTGSLEPLCLLTRISRLNLDQNALAGARFLDGFPYNIGFAC
jgi:hypothetical protein